MNIFVTNPCPRKSAMVLPDKHIVKMPLETCQMLAVVFSSGILIGVMIYYLRKTEHLTTPRKVLCGHPCTVWAGENIANTAWLIEHGFALLKEYENRYNKVHSCQTAMNAAEKVFEERTEKHYYAIKRQHHSHSAGPDEFKFDTSIDTFTAYKRYISSKPWVASNYLRDPSKKPDWV